MNIFGDFIGDSVKKSERIAELQAANQSLQQQVDALEAEIKKEKEYAIFERQEDELCIAHWKNETAEFRQAAVSELECSKALQQQVARLTAALAGLVAKMHLIDAEPTLSGIFTLAYIHGCEYKGPNWKDELELADAALLPSPVTKAETEKI